ncbi:MAG: flagellar basal body protein [Dissulfurispiraceae bacterium]
MSVDSVNSAESALKAYADTLSVTANNVANVNTAKFKPTDAVMNEGVNGGVYVTLSQSSQEGTDIAKETVDEISTEEGFKANVTSLQASEEMTKKLIDIVA